MQIRQEKGCYTLYKENEAIGTAVVDGTAILRLEVQDESNVVINVRDGELVADATPAETVPENA